MKVPKCKMSVSGEHSFIPRVEFKGNLLTGMKQGRFSLRCFLGIHKPKRFWVDYQDHYYCQRCGAYYRKTAFVSKATMDALEDIWSEEFSQKGAKRNG